MDFITDVAALKAGVSAPDDYNLFIPVSALALGPDGDEVGSLDRASSFQIEGFVLHPRRMEVQPVEIVTEDADEVAFILQVVRDSQAPLAYRQAGALALYPIGFTGSPLYRLGDALERA
jgi:hypothetical protein